MSKVHDYVVLAGIDLDEGESEYGDCPECGRRGKFSITRTSTGLLYQCFRDSCDARGHVAAVGVAQKPKKGKPKKNTLHPWTGDTRELNMLEKARFLAYNGLNREDIDRGRWKWAPDIHRYVFPVMDPRGYERGVVLRSFTQEPKALTRLHTEGPRMSWHVCDNTFRRVILVEDQISAVKLSRLWTTVALLGTSLSHEGAQEIAGVRPDHVTIALDADAINTAYKLKKWYGLLFDSTDVIHLRKDVKDMSQRQIEEKFGAT